MNPRQRSVAIRIIISLAVFIYVAIIAFRELPRFDFSVIMAIAGVYLTWNIICQAFLYQDPDVYVTEDDDRKSYIYLQFSFLIGLFYAAVDFVAYHFTRMYSLEPMVIYAGFILYLLSCVIIWQGFKAIGKYFNPRVAIYEEHKLITEGIYKTIRHPLYLGSIISSVSIALILSSWGALLIMLLTTIPALVYRINIEEKFMLKHFQEEYREYINKTKKLIPGLW